MTDKQNEALNEVINLFDFQKVQAIMLLLNWQWAVVKRGRCQSQVPNIDDMKSMVRSLAHILFSQDSLRVASGGFEVSRRSESDNGLDLAFILTEAWSGWHG